MRHFSLLDWRSASGLPYDEFLTQQDMLTERRFSGEIPDTVVLAKHPPTITLGARGIREQLAAIRVLPRALVAETSDTALLWAAQDYLKQRYGIALLRTKRGGSVWYHDTGVLNWYVIAEASPRFPAEILHILEETLYRGLVACNIPARRIPERHLSGGQQYLGIWIGERKVAGLGIRVLHRGGRSVTQFGAALNVSPDPTHLRFIDPCGIVGRDATSLAQAARGVTVTEAALEWALKDAFCEVFHGQWADEEKRTTGYA